MSAWAGRLCMCGGALGGVPVDPLVHTRCSVCATWTPLCRSAARGAATWTPFCRSAAHGTRSAAHGAATWTPLCHSVQPPLMLRMWTHADQMLMQSRNKKMSLSWRKQASWNEIARSCRKLGGHSRLSSRSIDDFSNAVYTRMAVRQDAT